MNFPDPEKALEAIERIKDAFQRAADNDTSAAQPHFVKLSQTFNKMADKAMELGNQTNDPNRLIMSLLPTMMQLKTTLTSIQQEAQRDPVAAATLDTLRGDIQVEVKGLLGGLGNMGFNFPNFPGFPGVPPMDPPDAPPSLPPRKPKKPGNGNFDL